MLDVLETSDDVVEMEELEASVVVTEDTDEDVVVVADVVAFAFVAVPLATVGVTVA